MSRWRSIPIEGFVLLYLLAYLPNVIVTKLVTSTPHPGLGRPLTGLETLPASLIISTVLTYVFIWLSGWHRDANGVEVAGRRIPIPTKYTLMSGFGTALVLFTVPLSFTFQNVSIPFIQLLMRGDILLIAPIVDLLFGRRVRWWSWAALAMVLLALAITLGDRGGLQLPPLAILTVILYTIGYFVRLLVMTKVSKNGDPASVRRYFVEEKVVALPMSVAALAVISALGIGGQSGQLGWGFVSVWADPVILPLIAIGTTLTVISVFAIVILLDPRENAYCVPLERAASLVAGVGGALLLAWFWGLPHPRTAELIGAGILIAAIVLLSIAPRLQRPVVVARAETT
jgi:drug/metabolite transporter (DMT)-like permease